MSYDEGGGEERRRADKAGTFDLSKGGGQSFLVEEKASSKVLADNRFCILEQSKGCCPGA